MPTYTLQTYLRRTLDLLYPERYQRYGQASGSGSTTTLLDADAFTSSISLTSNLVGSWIRTTTGTTTEYAIIASVNLTTGTLTLDRAVTSTTSSTTWELCYERNPAHIESLISRINENTYTPRLFPLTSHIVTNDDNDMESTATITGMWTAGGTPGAQAKDTATTFITGSQSLKVTATGAGDYSKIAVNVPVNASVQYWASVLESTTSGDDAEFKIVNVDNSDATIENATTDEVTWNELSFYFTPPSGCERINAHLVSTGAGDITYWDDLIIIDTQQVVFPCPSWLLYEEQMIDVFEMRSGHAGPHGDNDWRTLDSRLRSVHWKKAWQNLRATNEMAIQVPGHSGERKYIYAMGPGATLTTDASTSFLNPDVVAENVVWMLDNPDGARQHLRNLREKTMRAVERPKAKAMAYFA